MTRALGTLEKRAFDPEADEENAEADADSDAEPAGADVVDLLTLIQDRLKAPGVGRKKAGARKR